MSDKDVTAGAVSVDMASDDPAFRLLADNAPVLLWRAGPDMHRNWFNRRWLDFTGRTVDQEIGPGWSEGVHPDDRDRCLRICATATDARQPFSLDYRLRRHDGQYRWIRDDCAPYSLTDGRFGGYFGAGVDVTAHVEREAQLLGSNRRLEALIDELNHRVKNMLATVQSIAVQTFRKLSEGNGPLRLFEGRLAILGASQDLLARNQWRGAGLKETVRIAVGPFAGLDQPAIVYSGPDVMLTARQASALSFALHELCINAVKFGALSENRGLVTIEWRTEETEAGPRLVLVWSESGGPPVSPPAHRGFGLRMVERGLAHEFRGVVEIKFQPQGLMCTISSGLEGGATGSADG